MSKKFNVRNIVNERKNELDHSPLFQPKKPNPIVKDDSTSLSQAKEEIKLKEQDARMPGDQNASIPDKQQSRMPAFQSSSIPEIQHHITATEKVMYRFHPEGKYAIEDIKTILARKVGIKASYELIAEAAILIAYEDLLENQNASKLAKRLSRIPENRKSS